MNQLCLLLTFLTIAKGVPFMASSKSDIKEVKDLARWKSGAQEIARHSSRLAEFAEAVWNIHCDPQTPTHQHLLMLPSQKCDAPFPGLVPVQPLHSSNDFLWTNPLESSWLHVKSELEEYMKDTEQSSWKSSATKLCDNTKGFTKLTIQDDEGNLTDIGRTYFSKTLKLLQKHAGPSLAPRPVNINCQAPNSGLAPHSDNMNFILTCHLGLSIPKEGECIFRIGSKDYQWTEGKAVVADTSFVHETFNTSPSESRYVLSFSIWHPDLSEEERRGIVAIHSLLQHFS